MKKLLLFSVAVMISFNMTAQKRALVPSNFRNISLKKPIHAQMEYLSSQGEAPYLLKSTKAMSELEIGTTQYDLPSNSTVDHRCYLYSDGTIGTTYTLGNSPTAFPDRGTGYQYYDGTAWITPNPTVRIETIRTGWPSYSHLGVNNEGEVVIAHDFSTTLFMIKRDNKGTGAWATTALPAPSPLVPSWPRVATSGNTIHILASDNNPYLGQAYPIVYYRSQDAGTTWDIQAQFLPGLSPADGYTQGYGGDVYSWAEPQGNTIAFVIGDNWTDLSLMKSTDGGDTWTKTIIFLHPYFNFNEATTLTPDTPYVCDGAHAVALDASGNAHVVFGIMRVLNDDTADAATSWYPMTDGIAYWKEGDPTFTGARALNPDTLYVANKLVGYVQDLDGSGYILDNLTDISQIPNYYLSCSSMPQLSIDQTNGDMYLVYKSFVENMQSAGGTGQFYSHLWGRRFCTNNWGDFVEITGGPDHVEYECIFPAMSKTMDNQLHITYMSDFEPGLAVRGDEDPYTVNSIMHLTIDKTDFGCIVNVHETNISGTVNIYPNPVTESMSVTFAKSSVVKMIIYNALGSVVMSNTFAVNKGDIKEVNISNLSSGIYMAKFQTTDGTFSKKIIKK